MATIDWHLGDVVRALRDRKGWTQSQLATKAVVNKATIVSVEQMDRNHGRATYEKIAGAFKISIAELYALVPNNAIRQFDVSGSHTGETVIAGSTAKRTESGGQPFAASSTQASHVESAPVDVGDSASIRDVGDSVTLDKSAQAAQARGLAKVLA